MEEFLYWQADDMAKYKADLERLKREQERHDALARGHSANAAPFVPLDPEDM